MIIMGLKRSQRRERRGYMRLGTTAALLAALGCGDLLDEHLTQLFEHLEQEHGEQPPHGALALVQTAPANGSTEVDPETSFTLRFSRSVKDAELSVLDVTRGSAPVAGSVSISGHEVTFTPSEPLALAGEYTLRFLGNVRAHNGARWTEAIELAFETRDGAWGAPQNVTLDGNTPELAFGEQGTAVAIWQVPAGEQSARVALAELEPDGQWQQFPLSGTSGGPYSVPVELTAGDGAFELLWHSVGHLHGAVYRRGGELGAVVDSLPRGANPPGDGAIAGGHTWFTVNEFDVSITLSHTSDGTSWTPLPNLYSEENVAVLAGPRITTDAAGNARVFWITDLGLHVSTFTNGGELASWTPPELLLKRDTSFSAGSFEAEGSALGHSVLVWQEQLAASEPPTSRLRVVSMAPDGSVDEALPDPLDGLENAFSPALAVSARGSALTAWVASAGTESGGEAPARIGATHREADGATWSAPVALSTPAGVRARAPTLALDPDGNGHAVWLETDASGAAQVVTARFSQASGTFGDPRAISDTASPTYTPNPEELGHSDPRVAVAADGRALALWVGEDGGIWAARFE